MSNFVFCELADRALLRITGEDHVDFLQNLLTNDIHKARRGEMLYALLLTPQGKFLFDFFISKNGADGFLVDVQKSQIDELVKKLTLYRLRARVEFVRKDDLKVWFIWNQHNEKKFSEKNSFRDPRHADLGWRMISTTTPQNITPASPENYTSRRIALGIPEAGCELTPERFPLECNLDKLNAIDFNKGCYIGQEVTSRLHHRAEGGRRRLAIVKSDHPLAPPGTSILIETQLVGQLLSAQGNIGLAVIRRDRLSTTQTPQLQPKPQPLIEGQPVRLVL